MLTPASTSILIWILWALLILPLAALRILQGRNTPKYRGSTWLAILYFLGVLGCFGIAICFSVAFDGFGRRPFGAIVDWEGRVRYYIYIATNLHLYTSYILQCLTLQLLTLTLSRHTPHLTTLSPLIPLTLTTLYWLATATTILGFIASVCLEIFYCKGSNWRYLDRDPRRCPVWWSRTPLNAVAGVQFAAMVMLFITGVIVVVKVPRRKERVPGVVLGGAAMAAAIVMVIVRFALVNANVTSPLEDGWDVLAPLRVVEAIEVMGCIRCRRRRGEVRGRRKEVSGGMIE
ncbi:hypothetical protein EX30DRAFT_228085 [Ascodesmis nigricans]|uniref:Uncharacterized protein n=1 Tax=Ascodesmis nigricans TaxID=341454 RepID=A0A4S2MIR2_9PEZI|nr:hypothetical protein EX30DRAFT_228085 [Ascodesmis nigricans]